MGKKFIIFIEQLDSFFDLKQDIFVERQEYILAVKDQAQLERMLPILRSRYIRE